MKVLREDIRKNSFEELQHQKANIQFLMSYFQNPIPLRSYDIIEFENLKNIIINSLNSVFNNLKNAEMSINGKKCGLRISAPYLFDITDVSVDGINQATVVVSNTLAQKIRDRFSYFLQLKPSGLLGGICVKYENIN